jgi:hypothetical protein
MIETLSDGALMDMTPALARAKLQRDGDGMVGLLIVGRGVLVGGVVGQATQPQDRQSHSATQPHPRSRHSRRWVESGLIARAPQR